MKTQTIEFGKFVRNEWREEKKAVLLPVLGAYATMYPRLSMAADQAAKDRTFDEVLHAAMNIVDWLAVGVFVVAGLNFMFNNRTRGMEMLLCGSTGYIVARKAKTIQEFLESLVN